MGALPPPNRNKATGKQHQRCKACIREVEARKARERARVRYAQAVVAQVLYPQAFGAASR